MMLTEMIRVLGSFTSPIDIGTNPQSLLWVLPLTAAIAIVYKMTKLEKVTLKNFVKGSGALFGSIIVFISVTAIVLYIVQRIFTQ